MSGSSDGTQVIRNELPAFEQDARKFLLGQAQHQFENFTPQVDPQSGIVDPGAAITTGAQQLTEFGQSPFNTQMLNQANSNQNFLTNAQQNPLTQFAQRTTGAGELGLQQGAGGPPTIGEMFAGGVAGNTTGALNSALGTIPGQNPTVDALVQSSLDANNQNFLENVLPQVQNQSIGNNAFGGTRSQLAEGKAMSDLNRINAQTAADIGFKAYQDDAANRIQAANIGSQAIGQGGQQTLQGRGQGIDVGQIVADSLGQGQQLGQQGAQSAIGNLGRLGDANLRGTNELLRGGEIDRGFRQAVRDDQVNKFNFEQQQPRVAMNDLIQATAGVPLNIGQTTQPGPQSGGISSAIGGGLGGALLGGELGGSNAALIGALLGGLGGYFG